jgi:hypothetical protein
MRLKGGLKMRRVLLTFIVFGLAVALVGLSGAEEKKKQKDPGEGKKGTVIGTLVAKDKGWIEVRADGEEKARRYVPQWVGGMPSQGGGPDKAILKIYSDLKIGSRIEVEWLFEERLRSMKIKLIKGPAEKKTSKTVGTLQARENNRWLEVKADGEEKARKYFVHAKLPDKLLAAVRQVPIGSRVCVEWVSTSHGPIVESIEVLSKPRPEK